jgi:SAM-dependent methyltransferase
LACDSRELVEVLDLGLQPPANSYTDQPAPRTERFPLGLQRCSHCWHAQLTACVDRASIFKNYHYASGTSQTLKRFFVWFAKALAQALASNAKVLEIAANDGSLVQIMNEQGLRALGVDPATNIVAQAQARNIPVIEGFWPEVASVLPDKYDAIVCMNVVAHVDDPQGFLQACAQKLNAGGFILVQPSQARMFGNMEFDTCYHEHLSFFNIRSMQTLAARCGLRLAGSFLVKIHGDSPVYVLGRPDAPPDIDQVVAAFSSGEFAIAEDLPQYEEAIQLYSASTYDRFKSTAESLLSRLKQVIEEHRQLGYQIAFVGAAAKAMTVIHAADVKPDHFYDEAALKIGRYPPGLDMPIRPLSDCAQLRAKTLFVLTAWNFKDELIAKLKALGVPPQSLFYVYFPQPEMNAL